MRVSPTERAKIYWSREKTVVVREVSKTVPRALSSESRLSCWDHPLFVFKFKVCVCLGVPLLGAANRQFCPKILFKQYMKNMDMLVPREMTF